MMAYKNIHTTLCALALITFPSLSGAQEWNGTVLGFEAPPDPLLGDMGGMFVGILGMCVLGVALSAGIGLLERLACPWALQK